MQFKQPEILYALFLLLIPIVIHLFQLRRFEKVAFTNVHFLKKIQLQTRKSSKLKKFLILCTRLLLFTAIILAFAQPYLSKITINTKQHTSIYIDNSFSMQVKGNKGELLKRGVQDIIETISSTTKVDLYTNDNKWANLSSQDLKNTLLSLEYHPVKKDLQSTLLNIKTNLNKQKNTKKSVFLISDFQNNIIPNDIVNIDTSTLYNFIQLQPIKKTNITLDSVYISSRNNENVTLKVIAKSHNRSAQKIPVSLYNESILLGKSTIDITENSSAEIEFKVPFNQTINGRLHISDDNLNFDNELYFTINQVDKINVLAIGGNTDYLRKIYTNDEFNLKTTELKNLDYNSLMSQNLIILNEIENIPVTLVTSVSTAVKNGVHLVILPHLNSSLDSYNNLFKSLNIGAIKIKNNNELNITDINFKHPFFSNVFEKSIKNFQYPKVNTFYNSTLKNSAAIVSFENETPFISQMKNKNGNIYWLAAPIISANSNFKNSPLIVPVFYNFGKYSYNYSKLNYTVGNKNNIEIKANLQKDAILDIVANENSFIPMQQVGNTSVKIITEDAPNKAGIYAIKNKENTLKNIAFNYSRNESVLAYKNVKELVREKPNTNYYNSIKEAFSEANDSSKTTNLWKLFLAAGLLFLIVELLLLKFFKP